MQQAEPRPERKQIEPLGLFAEILIFVSTQPNIDLSELAVGDIVSVTGFSGQFDALRDRSPIPVGHFPAGQRLRHHLRSVSASNIEQNDAAGS